VSKAFTRESDEAGADEVAFRRPSPAPGVKRYITKAGADRLRQQANELREEKRALAAGGGAGNSETVGKTRRLEAAIQRTEETLDSIIVAEPPADPEKVGFGALVQIRGQDGEEEIYQIVGVDEADAEQGRISTLSPLAQALMNRRTGDKVRFKSPAGEQEMAVLGVHY
jgi:transcription elongation factor GreB